MSVDPKDRGKDLTTTQLEVLGLIVRGYDNFQIGAILDRSPCTVKNHIQSIYVRIGANSRQRASYLAIQKGLVECPNLAHPRCGHEVRSLKVERPEVIKELEVSKDLPIEWLKAGDIEINVETSSVRVRGQIARIGRPGVILLIHLLRHPGKAFTRQHLLDVIYSPDIDREERIVDMQVRRIRSALIKHGYGSLIKTIRYVGYGVMELPGKAS